MKMFLIMFGVLVTTELYAGLRSSYDHYQAVCAYHEGKFDQAQPLLSSIVERQAQDSQARFNLGSICYRQGNYQAAQDCFKTVAEDSTAKAHLREQAYFNSGNALVKQQRLALASTAYEQALELNPQNERARHNLELVKEMMKQQEQQQKQENKDDHKENKSDDNNKQEQQQDQPNDNKKDASSDREQNQSAAQDNQSKEDQQHQEKQSRHQQSSPDQSLSHKKAEQQQWDKHRQSAAPKEQEMKGQQDSTTGVQEKQQPSVAAQQQKQDQQTRQALGKQYAALLDEIEKCDEKQYKAVMQAEVKKQMMDTHGQKNW
jgi:Ca-activated chloride channel family protein